MKSTNNTASDIIIHAAELENRSEYSPAVSVFLTPSEQAELFRYVRYPHRLFFWGGFTGAERRSAVFIPEWAADSAPSEEHLRYDSAAREEFLKELIFGEDAPFPGVADEIRLLRIKGSGHRVLAHKDILGSVMGLGITRQSAGDICMLSDSESVIALSGKLTDYITEGLSKVATDGVSVYPVSDPASFTYERSFEEKSCTVASMRLDGIVSAITGLSRTRSAELISAGLVQISGIAEENLSREVTVGDTVTVRGYGKFRIDSTDGLTKKSRIRITVKKYT